MTISMPSVLHYTEYSKEFCEVIQQEQKNFIDNEFSLICKGIYLKLN